MDGIAGACRVCPAKTSLPVAQSASGKGVAQNGRRPQDPTAIFRCKVAKPPRHHGVQAAEASKARRPSFPMLRDAMRVPQSKRNTATVVRG